MPPTPEELLSYAPLVKKIAVSVRLRTSVHVDIEDLISAGALAAAQLFPQVKDRLIPQEYLDWTRAFLDTGDEILGTK